MLHDDVHQYIGMIGFRLLPFLFSCADKQFHISLEYCQTVQLYIESI